MFKKLLLVFLIFILLKVSYSKFIKKEYPVKLFGMSFLVVVTGSMEPEIETGELIVIKEIDKYKIGDIVTYVDQDNFLITHRIVDLKDKNMVTKGDNNNLLDEEIALKSIKGKVIIHSKILGFFVLYLLKPLIFLYIIILILINVITFWRKESEDKTNEKIEV